MPELQLTLTCILFRVRFLLGGRHGEFKFLPPPGYAPCYEAVLPKEKLKVEHSREYKQERTYTRDLLGPTVSLTQAAFTPIPVDTSQVPARQLWWQHLNHSQSTCSGFQTPWTATYRNAFHSNTIYMYKWSKFHKIMLTFTVSTYSLWVCSVFLVFLSH